MLFLHGYKSNKESFIRQITFFSRFYRVVAVDMCGFGKAESLPFPYSLSDYAKELAVADVWNTDFEEEFPDF